jgi:hypothetical protein
MFPRATRYPPQMVVATGLVVVLPVAVVWWLQARGTVASPAICVVVAMALALGPSLMRSAYWKRRRGPTDLLFSELLLWGWLRRVMDRAAAGDRD